MQVRLLGPVEAVAEGRTAALGAPRQRAVLAMLALAAPGVVSTDRFVDGLWGEVPPARPTPALQVFVHGLRKALREVSDDDPVQTTPPGYRLAVAADQVDAHLFAGLLERARGARDTGDLLAARVTLDQALALWRGPALSDVRTTPFAEAEAVRLDGLRLQAEEDAFDVRLGLGEDDALVEPLRKAVDAHPMRERFWGQLMTALYRCDRQAESLETYARARERLADELGIDPGQALRQLEVAVLRQDPSLAAPVATGRTAVAPRRARRVPVPLTPTFGRDELVSAVRKLVSDPGVRAVTLTGPGGSGKSRVAALAASDDPAAVYLGVTESTEVPRMLREVALTLTGGDDEAALADLAEDALVVLDNLESVSDGTDAVARLLELSSRITVLATSRLPLRIRAEHAVAVPPLDVPPPGATSAEIDRSPAVQMFADRAASESSGFSLVRHRDDVADLCRFVDGLPLALELAAARTTVLTPAEIADALRQDLALLTSRSVDVPTRQRTLATTIEWSRDRLSPDARLVLDRVALFERGFTLESVEAVCADVDDVVGCLADLVDARLIRPQESRVEVRFVVLGTVRSFTRTRLRELGDLDSHRQAHADHLLVTLRALGELLDGPDGAAALGRYDDRAVDVEAALDWATSTGRGALAAELVQAATDLWIASGRLGDGLRRTERLLTGPGLSAARMADLHVSAAKLAYHLTDWPAAAGACRAALALERSEIGAGAAPATLTTARCYLGAVLVVTGEAEQGATLAEAALLEAEQAGLHAVTVVALSVLAISRAILGDVDGERAWHERRLGVVTAHGDVARIADTLNTLAEIALDDADADTARAYAAESVAIADPAFPLELRDATITLARASAVDGDAAGTAEQLRRGSELADRTGQTLAIAQCLRVGGCLAVLADAPALAVRAFAAAQHLSPSPSGDDVPMESDLAARLAEARTAIGDAAFGREWALGRTLPVSTVRASVAALIGPGAID